MDIHMLRTFFMWCTIIDAGLLILMCLIFTFAGDSIYRLHTKMFPMARETFSAVIYSFLGLFKIVFLVFNLVPYVTLLMMK